MADISNISEAYSWSVSRLAECFGVHRQTLAKRLKDGGVQPAGTHRGNPVYAIRDAAAVIHAPASGPSAVLDLDNYPESRKAWYQSENEKLKFEVSKGELITDSEYARALAFLIKSFTAALDSLPDQLERDAGLEPEAIVIAQAVCDGARESTYQSVIRYTEAPDEDDD